MSRVYVKCSFVVRSYLNINRLSTLMTNLALVGLKILNFSTPLMLLNDTSLGMVRVIAYMGGLSNISY